MEITIKPNDAFQVLQAITRDRITKVDEHIVRHLSNHENIELDSDDYGRSIQDVITERSTKTVNQVLKYMFMSVDNRSEIKELLNHLIFVNAKADHPCPECGCELEFETDGFGNVEWVETACSNSNCEYQDTNEPDWDLNRKR